MHFHAYSLKNLDKRLKLNLSTRVSTGANGIAACLGLQVSPLVELEVILTTLQSKISTKTLLTV